MTKRTLAPWVAPIAEVEMEAEETQELLARLTAADEGRSLEGLPWSVGRYVRWFTHDYKHDREHLAELRAALEGHA